MKSQTIISVLFALSVAGVLLTTCYQGKPIAKQGEGIIRGYVYADVSINKERVEHIFIPDVQVSIKNEKDSVVNMVNTRLDGSYATKELINGRYKICLSKNGFMLSCYEAVIENSANHPGPLKINYGKDNFIWGTVKLKDGRAGYYKQQVFAVDIDTRIYVNPADTATYTRCNIYGYYLIPNLNARGKGKITAKCENVFTTASLNGEPRIDMVFPNSSPAISSIIAFDGNGKSILRTGPGRKIKLRAYVKDADNNTLHYQWIPFGKFTGFVSVDAPELDWELPAKAGKYEMDLMVFDRLGGVAYKSYTINAGDGSVYFTGTVSGIDGSGRIANALIKVNGHFSTFTDANGYFTLKVPENDRQSYVLNVSKSGYSLFSKIYFNDALQKEYKLIPSTTQTFDPTGDISLTERPDKYTRLDDKRRLPAMVSIPKNSIVDSTGKTVNVPVNVSIRSIDITNPNGQMPGNFGGISDGKIVRLESVGAVDVQIRDKAHPEIKYNLVPTANAELSIPMLAAHASKAPDKISFWDYNDSTGTWEKIGSGTKTGMYFKGITHKFSVLNADFELNNGTFLVLKDNPNNSVFSHAGPIDIRLFAPQTSGGVVQGYHVIDNLQPGDLNSGNGLPVVNLAANTVVTVQIISNGTVINTLNPRTGAVIQGSASCCPPPSPSFPYNPAAEQIYMLPDLLTLDQQQLDQFLTAEQNINGSIDGDNYYTLIGANNYTSTANPVPHTISFDEWKEKNGYNADGTGDVNSVYFNAGDLAFWRGMHQKTAPVTNAISYYVSNFSNDNDAIQNQNALATVCMEYSPIVVGSGNSNVTKFYVFNDAGQLVNSANLDGNNFGPDNGFKFVPGLCITCHGGSGNLDYSPGNFANGAVLQNYFNGQHRQEIPNFLPFDAKSFYYSTATGYTRIAQEENIRQLNNKILSVQNTQAIIDFVNTSYNNQPGTAGQKYIDNAVVDKGGAGITWNTATTINNIKPSDFYVDVVATSCRTCHIARTDLQIWFDTQQKFSLRKTSINFLVCPASPNRYMPNSKVTYLNFWTSEAPVRSLQVRQFLGLTGTSCQ